MALLAAVVLWRVNAQIASVAWVEHTYQVIECSKDAQIDLRDMAVSANSYWFSADKRYLTDFQNADRRLRTDLKRISALVIDNPPQQERVLKATELHGAWADAWSETIQALKAHDNQALPNRLAQLDAQRQAVLDVLSEITDEEDRLLRERKGWQETENRVIFIFVPLLFVIGALVLSYEGWREMSRASGQFAQALARAGEASRAKDNFLAIVSHELRNPLNSIMLLTHILLSSQEDQQKVLERVKAIDRAARTQAQLIEDLLDVSRVESGRLKLDVQATNLGQVVKAAVDSMRIAAEAKSINLYDIIDTSVPVIAGDPKRLEQVVWNLVSNAIKFTPKGGKVQVRLERINSHVDIVVTDNGQGIAPSSLPQVFDRFWQETESGQSRTGVGLGLSIVKELVALHGGTVMAHSEGIGKGSTFTVRLPLPPAAASLLEPRRHPTIASADSVQVASRLDGLSLLVVDDDPEACEALTKLLSSLGARAEAENSAQAALGRLEKGRPDVIVADIEMPIHDGFFFAREVRRREQEQKWRDRVPLVALTAYGRVEDKVKILASGFDGHLIKPVELAELSATIRSLVTARAAAFQTSVT